MISTRASCASAGDLDDLLLTDAQVAHRGLGVERLVEALHQLRRDLALALLVDHDAAADALARHEDVVRDVEVREEAELLVDDRDAAVGGVAWTVDLDGLSVELERAGGRLDPGEDLHERRLAGAVLAEQADLARDDVEVDAAQRVRGAEHLVDAARAHDGLGGDAHDAASSFTGVIVTTVGAR